MPYTDDPEHVPADAVRFLVGDTSTSAPQLTDNEIAFLLSDQGDNTVRAAARGAEMLSARFASQEDERRVGPLTLRSFATTKAKRYADLAKALWARSAATDATPFAGGISKDDKQARELDSDRVRPAFARKMQHYRLGSPAADARDTVVSE